MEKSKCVICDDLSRDSKILCILKDPTDIFAIEKTGYYGMYHILGGLINPIDGISPDDLNIESLFTRLNISQEGNITPGSSSQNIGDGTTNFASIWASTRFRGNDNVKLVLGASQNLVVRYDGSNNIIGSPVGNNLHIKSKK